MRIKTVQDLKDHLNQVLEELENYDDADEVKTYANTYWLGSSHFLATGYGFINLDNPTDRKDDDEEED